MVLALDLSESMSALDFKKENQIVTRLEAVKYVVNDFILKRDGDRIGMSFQGGEARRPMVTTSLRCAAPNAGRPQERRGARVLTFPAPPRLAIQRTNLPICSCSSRASTVW